MCEEIHKSLGTLLSYINDNNIRCSDIGLSLKIKDQLQSIESKIMSLDLKCKYMCNKNDVRTTIAELVKTYNSTEPFKSYYNNTVQTVDVFVVYSNEYFHLVPHKCKYDYSKYGEYDKQPVAKYSTPEIPVYFRKINELIDMIENAYYDSFFIDQYECKRFNPTILYSRICGKYIITPTVSPFNRSDVVAMAYNYETKVHLSSLDFYSSPNLMVDMYEIFCNLSEGNKKYVMLNSLEVGSLPEIFHFHILVSELIQPIMEKVDIGSPYIHLYHVKSTRAWCEMHAFNLTESGKNVSNLLNLLPQFLYNCRLNVENGTSYKYCPQLYFANINEQSYLFLPFRRVNTKHINIVERNGINSMNPEYFSELFGNVAREHKLIYFPISILVYRNESGIPLDMAHMPQNVYNDMKLPHKIHPNFIANLKQVVDEKVFHYTYATIPTNIESMCLGINTNFDDVVRRIQKNADGKNNFIINVTCDNFPIMYKIGYTEILQETMEHGRLLISGNQFYYIKPNSAQLAEQITQICDTDTESIFPKYYGQVVNTAKGLEEYYLIFEPVKTTLYDFLLIDSNLLKNDSSILHTFLATVIHKIYLLSQVGKYYENIDVFNLLVQDEEHNHIDLRFDEDIITMANNNDAFKFKHYGHTISFCIREVNVKLGGGVNKLGINNPQLFSEMTRKFVNSFHFRCIELNIYNLLLDSLNSFISNTDDFTMKECIMYFLWAMDDIVAYRAPSWEILMILQQLYKIEPINDYNLYQKVVELVKSSNYDIEAEFPNKMVIPKDKVFVTGNGFKTKESTPDFVGFTEEKFKSELNAIWFSDTSDIKREGQDKYSQYVTNLIMVYMGNNNTGRLLFVNAKEDIHLISLHQSDTISVNVLTNVLLDLCENIFQIDLFREDGRAVYQHIKGLGNEKFKLESKYGGDIWGILTLMQDLFNFGLKIKYPNLPGYTCFIQTDGAREYVINNTPKYFNLVSIACPVSDGLKYFTNNTLYAEHLKTIKNNFVEYKVAPNDFANVLVNNIPTINKYNAYLVKSGYNFFTRPIVSWEINRIVKEQVNPK